MFNKPKRRINIDSGVESVSALLKEVLSSYNYNYYEEVLPQIVALVEKGVIGFEYGDPVIVQVAEGPELEVRQSIKLIDKSEEKIKKLEEELKKLRDEVDGARYN